MVTVPSLTSTMEGVLKHEKYDFYLSSKVMLNILVLIIMKVICSLMTFDQQRYLYFRDRMQGNWCHERWLPVYALAKEEYCF
jgi:hypothetical protein